MSQCLILNKLQGYRHKGIDGCHTTADSLLSGPEWIGAAGCYGIGSIYLFIYSNLMTLKENTARLSLKTFPCGETS